VGAHGDVDWANPLAVCLVIGVAAMVVVDLWVRAHLSRPRG